MVNTTKNVGEEARWHWRGGGPTAHGHQCGMRGAFCVWASGWRKIRSPLAALELHVVCYRQADDYVSHTITI